MTKVTIHDDDTFTQEEIDQMYDDAFEPIKKVFDMMEAEFDKLEAEWDVIVGMIMDYLEK